MEKFRALACVLAAPSMLLGCSTLPVSPSAPSEVAVTVAAPEHPCSSLPDAVNVGLSIANQGQGTFRTYVATSPGPPYKLSWLSYDVLSESPSGSNVEWNHGAGGHGPLPQNTLAIGPKESINVIAKIYSTAQMSKTASYRIRIEDKSDQVYLSSPFKICQSTGATGRPSNNSSKPTPLRGAA